MALAGYRLTLFFFTGNEKLQHTRVQLKSIQDLLLENYKLLRTQINSQINETK